MLPEVCSPTPEANVGSRLIAVLRDVLACELVRMRAVAQSGRRRFLFRPLDRPAVAQDPRIIQNALTRIAAVP